MQYALKNKVALVTGGSRGLGRWICIALAQAGASVGVNYASDGTSAEQTVRMIRESGGNAVAVQGDVTREEEVLRVVQQVKEQYQGCVDILVNNAIGRHKPCPIEDSTWETYMDQLKYTLKAPLLLTKAVLPEMKARRSGSIVNIGSEVVQLGNPRFAHYVSAKAAVIGLTRSWATELAPAGIRVNMVSPGWIPVERHQTSDPNEMEAYRSGVPMGRMGLPAEVASAVLFFASDAASFVTGECMTVNGGYVYGI